MTENKQEYIHAQELLRRHPIEGKRAELRAAATEELSAHDVSNFLQGG